MNFIVKVDPSPKSGSILLPVVSISTSSKPERRILPVSIFWSLQIFTNLIWDFVHQNRVGSYVADYLSRAEFNDNR